MVFCALAETVVVLLEKMVHEKRNVVLALPERRKVDGNDVQAVEEVRAEFLVGHGFLEVRIRGRDEPHIDFDRVVPPTE